MADANDDNENVTAYMVEDEAAPPPPAYSPDEAKAKEATSPPKKKTIAWYQERKKFHVKSGVRTRTLKTKSRAHRRRKSVAFGKLLVDESKHVPANSSNNNSSATHSAAPLGHRRRSTKSKGDLATFASLVGVKDVRQRSATLKAPRKRGKATTPRENSTSKKSSTESQSVSVTRDTPKNLRRIRYYKNKLPPDGGIVIRRINEEKGKGMFATQSYKEGDVIFVEHKLLGIQIFESRLQTLACDYCMTALGCIEDHLESLSDKQTIKSPPRFPMKSESVKAREIKPISCKGKCGALYCSIKCRVEAHMSYHQLLCPNDPVNGRLLKDFIDHAFDTNENFIMAAQCIAMIIRRMKNGGMPLEEAMRPFRYFRRELWWKVVQPPDEMTYEEAMGFTEGLRSMANESLKLLKKALCTMSEYESLFEEDFYGSLIGMLEMNNWGTSATNPLTEYWEDIQRLSKAERAQVKKRLGSYWWGLLSEKYKTPSIGTGIYVLGSTINHSCMPNVALTKRDGDKNDTSAIVAIRPISAGEEICLSYIDETMRLRERQEALSEFQFECRCPKCTRDIMFQPPDIVVYMSNVSGSTMSRKDLRKIQHLLEANKLKFKEIDISLDENSFDKEFMYRKSGGLQTIPQVFVNGVFRGAYKDLEAANEKGSFMQFIKFGELKKVKRKATVVADEYSDED